MIWEGNIFTSCFTIIGTTQSLKLKPREVVLTFDDGPNASVTSDILDVLEKHRVQASFSIIGLQAQLFPALIQRAVKEGHTLVNHTMHHAGASCRGGTIKPFWSLSKSELLQEISECEKVIGKALNQEDYQSRFFRPPLGLLTPAVRGCLQERKLKLAGLTFYADDASQDSTCKTQAIEAVVQTISKRDGGVFVLHEKRFDADGHGLTEMPGQKGNDRTWVPAALDQILAQLAQKEFIIANPGDIFSR